MDTPDDEFDFPPPAYASRTTLVTPAAQDIQCSLPRYSGSPGEFERVVAPDTSHEDTFVFKSSHIEMDMGPRKWTKRIPAYGRHAIVRGAFTVTGGWKSCRVSLTGTVVNTSLLHGEYAPPQYHKVLDVSETISAESNQAGAQTFELRIPEKTSAHEDMPPSVHTQLAHATCDVDYILRLELTRSKLFLKKENLTVRLFYLPKSEPKVEPLTSIPSPTSRLYPTGDRLKTVSVPSPVGGGLMLSTTCFHDLLGGVLSASSCSCLHITFPSPQTYSAGATIPVIITLPSMSVIDRPQAELELVRRSRLPTKKNGEDAICTDLTQISKASVRLLPGERDRILGQLEMGTVGLECSWNVQDLIRIEYYIRVTVKCNEVAYMHQEPVTICTDPFGTLAWELASFGGPVPALGLARSQRKRLRNNGKEF